MRSRRLQRAGIILGAILAAILFFVGGAALRLLMGPISLGPFAGAIEDSVNRSLIGLVVQFDQAVLEWSRSEGQINLIIVGTNVFDSAGRIVAQAPRSDLDFNVASLLAGEFALKNFTLQGVQLTAVRDIDGSLKLGFGQTESDVDLFDLIRNTLDTEGSDSNALESFSIQGARVAFRDENTGLFIVSPNANFSVVKNQYQFEASLEADMELSGVPAQLAAVVTIDYAGIPQSGTLNILGLDLVALAANSEPFSMLAPYALTTDMAADFELSNDGYLEEVSFRFDGAGTVAPPTLGRVLQLDLFQVQGRFERENAQLTIEDAQIESPDGAATFAGLINIGWDEGSLEFLQADVEVEDLRFDFSDFFVAPVNISAANVSATYDNLTKTIFWQSVALEGDNLQAEFEGTTAFPANLTPAIYLTGSIDRLAASDMLLFWPTTLATGARSWVADNISEGFVGPIGFASDIAAGMLSQDALPEEAIALAFPVEGVTANYMTGLTPLTELKGDALLSGNTFQMSVSEARIGPLSAFDGEFVIPNLHIFQPPGYIQASVSGAMADVLALIDMEPLGYPTRFQVEPSAVSGNVVVELDLTVPMRRNLDVDDVRIAISASTSGLSLPLSQTRILKNARAQIFIDNDHLTAEGTGDLNDVPMLFTWEENFQAQNVYSTHIGVRGTLDADGFEKLHLATPDWMSGPISVSVTFLGRQFNFERAEVQADLTAVDLDIEYINFVKESGHRASGSGTIDFLEGGSTVISDMLVDGAGLEISGEFTLDEVGSLVSASFPTFRYGERGDFGLEFDVPDGSTPSWHLHGNSVDASRIFSDNSGEGETGNPGELSHLDDQEIAPVNLALDVEAVTVREEIVLSDVLFRYSIGDHERLTDFHLDAKGPGEGTIIGRFNDEDSMRRLMISSNQAGEFVEAFTGFSSLRGGAIEVEANFRLGTSQETQILGEDYGGSIRITDFSVVDQPFLARLFSVGSLDGPLRLLQNEGIPFAELEVPFLARGSQVNLSQGRASGTAIGISFEGVIDHAQDTVDINGSLVPLFGLNNILGGLPLIGDLLVSNDGEGIIGLTYQARGYLYEPQVLVNPLSVLTPGILRRIFEFTGPPQLFGAVDDASTQPAADSSIDSVPSQTE